MRHADTSRKESVVEIEDVRFEYQQNGSRVEIVVYIPEDGHPWMEVLYTEEVSERPPVSILRIDRGLRDVLRSEEERQIEGLLFDENGMRKVRGHLNQANRLLKSYERYLQVAA